MVGEQNDLSRWIDRVHHADCLDVLRELPDCSVDLCATDPPYALSNGPNAKGGFMGKSWDAALPARAIWAEVLRVLKPGASCFVCAGSRQDTILGLLTDLREVGFDIQHAALSWVYFSGFPKARRLSIDSASLIPEGVRCRCAETTSSSERTVPLSELAAHMRTDLLVRVAEAAEASDLQQVASLARSCAGMQCTSHTCPTESPSSHKHTARGLPWAVSASEAPSAPSETSEPPGSQGDCLPGHRSGDALLHLLQVVCRALLRLQGYAPAHTHVPEPAGGRVDAPSHIPCPARRTDLRANMDCSHRVGLQHAWQWLQECASARFPSASLSSYASSKGRSLLRESPAACGRSVCRSERTSCSVFDLPLNALLFVGEWEAEHILPHSGVCVKCGGVRIAEGFATGSIPLKPSSEQILWVTKPAEPGPARNNVLKWGTGACNIGECRVPFAGEDEPDKHFPTGIAMPTGFKRTVGVHTDEPHPQGRYPSNLLVSARALGDDSKYGDLDAWAAARGLSPEWLDAALSAGVLRVSKPSRSEKNAGCEGMEERENSQQYGNIQDGRPHTPDGYEYDRKPYRNHHPTTKPTTLFAFLCTLACPRGGVVLDPFGGSGTTGVAAITCGMHWVLCEREAEYVAIAEARTEHARQVSLQLQEAAE